MPLDAIAFVHGTTVTIGSDRFMIKGSNAQAATIDCTMLALYGDR
jgi:hypothetical protein